MWPCGSKRTSLVSWRCCERTPGSPCRRFLSGSRDGRPSPRCSRRESSLWAGSGTCYQHAPTAARPSGCMSGRPSLVCISSPVCWSWRWWASRLEASLRSSISPTSRPLRSPPALLPDRAPAPSTMAYQHHISAALSHLEEKEPHDLGQSAVPPVTRALDSDAAPPHHSRTDPQQVLKPTTTDV